MYGINICIAQRKINQKAQELKGGTEVLQQNPISKKKMHNYRHRAHKRNRNEITRKSYFPMQNHKSVRYSGAKQGIHSLGCHQRIPHTHTQSRPKVTA